jgi:hypothetical protein
MKKECDRNGLEYELLMQESTKERFLRQIKANPTPFGNFANSFVIMKQKRDSEVPAEDEPIVGAPRGIVVQPGYEKPATPAAKNQKGDNLEDDEENVGAPQKEKENVGFPLTIKAAALDGKLAIAGLSKGFAPGKLLISLRDSIAPRPTAPPAPPRRPAASVTFPTLAPITFPSRAPPPAFPSLHSLSLNPFGSILGAPAPESSKDEAAEDDEE